MIITNEDMNKKEVISVDGKKLGVIIDTEVETNAWGISSLIIRVNKDAIPLLGLKKSFFRATIMRVKPDMVQGMDDLVRLNVNTNQLRSKVGVPEAAKSQGQDKNQKAKK